MSSENVKEPNNKHALRRIFTSAEEVHFEDFSAIAAIDPDTLPALDKELIRHPRNDLSNSRRLIARHGDNIKFVREHGWYGWTSQYWSLDNGTRIVREAAQNTADKIRGEALAVAALGNFEDETPKEFKERLRAWRNFARSSGNTPRISAMIEEAKSGLEIVPEELDTHSCLVNVENGTLNLKAPDNGAENFDGIVLEPHTRDHFITKLAAVYYDPQALSPRFRRFIDEIQPDYEIANFLQRWFGYCLTGSMKEQVILMCYGSGSNGKSVLMSLMNRLFGTYGQVLPFASLLHDDKRRGSEPSPDLAQLPGARLVTAAEPETGAKFSESMIKQITGGEKIKARHLRQDFFEFRPECKVMLSFNNKPIIRGQDDGIWRRLLLVPFKQRYVEQHELTAYPGAKLKDKDLEAKLWEEAPGILNWVLDGYRMWAENGLQIPDKVRAATSQYRDESSPVREFLSGCTARKPGQSTRAGILFEAFKLWAADNAIDPRNSTWFGYRMKELHFEKHSDGKNVFYSGLSLSKEMMERLNDIG
ncbi:MAG: phage/plasmid primase, P4 family [Alphaproteobacteria bacterium]